MMTCEQAMETLTAQLMGELTDGLLDEHLETCDRCRREAEKTRALWQDLGELEEPAEAVPSTRLRARFYTMLAESQVQTQAETDDAPIPNGSRSPSRNDRRTERTSSSEARPATGRVLAWPQRLLSSDVTRLAAAASVLVAVLAGTLTFGWWLGGGGRSSGDVDSLRDEVRSLHEMVALSLLEQPTATDRLRGVSFGAHLDPSDRPDRPVVAALVDTVAHDPNVNVRLAAIDALAPVASEPMVRDGLIRALPQQDAPMVQIALADLLLDADGPAARDAVRSLLDDPKLRPEVRNHLGQRLGRSI